MQKSDIRIITQEISVSTEGFTDIINITPFVKEILEKSKIADGTINVSVPGSTASVTTIEYEPGLVQDLKSACERLVPSKAVYAHDQTWHDGNGFSHVRAALFGSSESFSVKDGEVLLGTWQQIVLIDFDNTPRKRRVVIQLIGR
jgi:secondary thiamine-phosphate synthase enzyme